MSAEDASAEPIRKKARTYLTFDNALSSSTSSCSPPINLQQRADELSCKLRIFYQENPEMKYVMQCEKLQANMKSAVEKYRCEFKNERESPLYSLPDEVLRRCLSYVGEDQFGLVAPASKKFCKAYKEEYGNQEARLTTSYKSASASSNTARFCVENLCKTLEEKDEIFKEAALSGNIDVLRYASSIGYDFLPIFCSKSKAKKYEECTFGNVFIGCIIEEIVANGYLHILKYFHEELAFQFGTKAFCRPAIKHGQFEILEWLKSIDSLHFSSLRGVLASGRVDAFKWVKSLKVMYEDEPRWDINSAIYSESINMIQYCLEIGLHFNDLSQAAVVDTDNIEVFRFCYEHGLEFGTFSMERTLSRMSDGFYEAKKHGLEYEAGKYFEIVKFLLSIEVPRYEHMMELSICFGNLEMVQYAFENNFPFTDYNTVLGFVDQGPTIPAKLKYLIENGFDVSSYVCNNSQFHNDCILKSKDLTLLECFIGRNARFDNSVLRNILHPRETWQSRRSIQYSHHLPRHRTTQIVKEYEPVWFEGVQFILTKGKNIEIFIEDLFREDYLNMDLIKILRTHERCHWTRKYEERNKFLCKIACTLAIEDVKWVYENGCRGGLPVPFDIELWRKDGMMRRSQWYANYDFLSGHGILDFNIQMIGNECMQYDFSERFKDYGMKKIVEEMSCSLYAYSLDLDVNLTSFLANRGYKYGFAAQKNVMTFLAYRKCCYDFCADNRKILALLLSLRTRHKFE
ncbi:hypothetical protein CTEN210_12004 [Chaetoceros tenuissimus]|uniref:Uncharacterized protein n=1 Tax=Chaetoceros tenuissimus TaxID=426638 RepID=A0AAD3D0P2_9STRA|nr:hypothetical protein CTEN210_12004 [Chaetoceros tenuissimus]